MPDKLKESKFKGKEPGGNKNRGVSKPNRGGGGGNAPPANASNSNNPKNKGNLNLLKKVKGGKAFKSGMGDKP